MAAPAADAAALMQANLMAQAEIGLGTLTQQQADDLRQEQENCTDQINGRQYLYCLQLAASQRLADLHGDTCPPTCRLNPGETLTACRAIGYLADAQYTLLKNAFLSSVQDQMPTFQQITSGQTSGLTKALPVEKVCELFYKNFKECLKREMLPAVAAGAHEYQRQCTLALTSNFRIAFLGVVQLEKRLAEVHDDVAAITTTASSTTTAADPKKTPGGVIKTDAKGRICIAHLRGKCTKGDKCKDMHRAPKARLLRVCKSFNITLSEADLKKFVKE